jgi:hypothetical protein
VTHGAINDIQVCSALIEISSAGTGYQGAPIFGMETAPPGDRTRMETATGLPALERRLISMKETHSILMMS